MQRYGKIDPNDANRVIYAANGGVYNGRLYPTFPDAVQRALGNLPAAPDTPPKDPAPEGYHYETRNFAVEGGEIRRQYVAVQDPPPPPLTFSKLKLFAALSQAGLWDALKAWLAAQSFEGMNAWDAFTLANELTEDHPMFNQWFAAAKTALGVTDEQAEAILAASVAVQ